MIEEQATVVAINNNLITVESKVKSTCSSCQQVNECGSGQVAKAIPQRKLVVTLENSLGVKVTDIVIIGIPEDKLLQSAWQVYFLPLLGLIGFSAIGQWLNSIMLLEHEFITILLAFVGGYLGYKLARRLQNRLLCQQNLQPRLLRKQFETINFHEISPNNN